MSYLLEKLDARIAATDPKHHDAVNVSLLIECRDRLRQLEYEENQRRNDEGWGQHHQHPLHSGIALPTLSTSEIRAGGGV